ncbi:MAG: ABC transporter ATP-binding protein [Planctomycetes bacterium]|nr:ABC transporter ATP-binding protein [Planctomycetota bacterium]
MSGTTILKAQGLELWRGKKAVLRGFDLELTPGAVTVLLGRNGGGKSSFLRACLGLLPWRRGTLEVLGLDPRRRQRQVLEQVGYVPDVPDAYEWMKARELMRFLAPHYPSWDAAEAERCLERFHVPHDVPLAGLSRGQGALLMLAAALAPKPKLLLLDEPFAGLDAVAREEVLRALIGALGEGEERSVLCTTHDLDVAARIADRIAWLEDGRIREHGTLPEVLGATDDEELAGAPRRLAEKFLGVEMSSHA